MARLLFGTSMARVKKAVGFCFLSYTVYDHLYTGAIAKLRQHEGRRYSTTRASSIIASTNAYHKLPDQRSIRLIKLYGAANLDDDIHIDLITASLDKSLSYEALSYTWDSQLRDQVIYANGQEFYITKNAQAAMRQLRLIPGKLKYLWIDAVCINQDDMAEKNLQVAIMAEIFKKATKVNIWLGDNNKSIDYVFNRAKSDKEDYLLRQLCYKKATLEVDKIFAVRAFFPETFSIVTPDYSHTAAKVYTDAAWTLLDASRNVKFMRFACHSDRNDGLPTWAPAWTPTGSHRWIWGTTNTRRLFPQPALVSKDDNESVLKIKGLRVDTLTATISDFIPKVASRGGELPDKAFKDYPSAPVACAIFKSWVKTLSAMSNRDIYLNRLDEMVSRLSQLYLGQTRLFQIVEDFNYNTDGKYSIRAELGEIASVESDLARLAVEIEDQCFFLTTAERVGISTVPVREGDEIALLTGETLPYIIRKSPDQPGKYTVVSPCLVAGGVQHDPWQDWFWGRPKAQLVEQANCKNWEYIELV
ncbi:Heterokaryon incompatibility protein 6 [Cladobotryum mycophilum]|uniref:Heterokaryon incompatibility protein 6 n=1 Tax=Cladobotryum mycophilum TaxID=491253 RepID=A0ABR0SKF0_9HYPO